MTSPRGILFGLGLVAFAGLGWAVIAAGEPKPAEVPRGRPPSVEDEIRELKRRCGKLETERAELQKKVRAGGVLLEKARKEIEQAHGKIKTANDRINTAVAQAKLNRKHDVAKSTTSFNDLKKDLKTVKATAKVAKDLADANKAWIDGPANKKNLGNLSVRSYIGLIAKLYVGGGPNWDHHVIFDCDPITLQQKTKFRGNPLK